MTLKRDESIGDAATNRTGARGMIWRAPIGLAGSAFFLFLLLRQVPLDELGDAFGGVQWLWVAAAALPFAAGLWFDRTGSYSASFTLFAVLFVVAATAIAFASYPRRGAAALRT